LADDKLIAMYKYIVYLIAVTLFISCGRDPEKTTVDKSPQIKKQIKDTIEKVDTPLVCVDYSELGTYEAEKGSNKYKVKKYFKGKTELTQDYVVNHLFGGIDSISTENMWSGEIVEKESIAAHVSTYDFYLIGTIAKKPLYKVVLYEEIEGDYSEKFLSTIDNKGNFIARILIAEYGPTTTYIDNHGERKPFYTQINGCLYKDMTITKEGGDGMDMSENNNYYKIQPNGKIIRVK
jgi:hypothetical protein